MLTGVYSTLRIRRKWRIENMLTGEAEMLSCAKERVKMIQINKLKGLENVSDCYYIDNDLNLWNKKTKSIKKATLGKRNYYYYSLNEKMTNKQVKISKHRIVALAFIPNPYNLPQVNHKDGNKLNNCVKNLEWCSASENSIHAIKNKLHTIKATEYKLTLLNGKHYIGTIADISFETGIPWPTLYDIANGKCSGAKHEIYSLKVNRLGVVRNNCRRVRDKH